MRMILATILCCLFSIPAGARGAPADFHILPSRHREYDMGLGIRMVVSRTSHCNVASTAHYPAYFDEYFNCHSYQ